jgi:hypothetical protein
VCSKTILEFYTRRRVDATAMAANYSTPRSGIESTAEQPDRVRRLTRGWFWPAHPARPAGNVDNKDIQPPKGRAENGFDPRGAFVAYRLGASVDRTGMIVNEPRISTGLEPMLAVIWNENVLPQWSAFVLGTIGSDSKPASRGVRALAFAVVD